MDLRRDIAPTIDIGGRAVPVRLRRNHRAKRIILRVDPETRGAVVTLPPGASEVEAYRLVHDKAEWLLAQMAALPRRIVFADGAVVPYLGVDHQIRHRPEARGVARGDDGYFVVGGRPEHLARRLRDWLKARARLEITPLADEKAARLGRPRGAITVRDTRSRWGSCAVNGALSFSWRLILAPRDVLDYVVAHEIAHLAHHNHSREFWATVSTLTEAPAPARRWLHHHGQRLHQYG